MKYILVLVYLCVVYTSVYTQITFQQELFTGGIIGTGYSPSYNQTNFNGTFETESIPSGSTIKKAYLFAGQIGESEIFKFSFNNTEYEFNQNTIISDGFISEVYGGESAVHVIDISSSINLIQTTYQISSIDELTESKDRFSDFYLYIMYENSNLPLLNAVIILNNKNFEDTISYHVEYLNPITVLQDVGISLFCGYICDNQFDAERLSINNIDCGLFGGSDLNSGHCGGPSGDFHHFNSNFSGLNGDNANTGFNDNNLIRNINNIISNNETELHLVYSSETIGNNTNSIWANFISYDTPCQPFPVTVSPDTIICRNSPPLQLSASGGTQYLWQPATDLSCTTCPNPVFTGDSSRFYTVRIWNNDSCSVVRPVKVNVKPLPSFSSMQVSPSSCGGNTGYIVSNSTLLGESYSINGGALQQTGSFPSLSSGTYTVTLHELNGCTRDSVVTVGTNITVDALFTATPHSGGAPLTVYFNNQSTNATAYEWFLNNQTQGNSFSNFTFDTTGIYTVTLVAWQNDPSCADTFSIQIHVYDSLIVQVPNVFTPNNDGKNDIFGIQANIPVSIDYQILNRWGNVMISGKEVISAPTASGNQFTILWDGSGATEGTYFYKIEVTALSNGKKEVLDGFMELIR